MITLGEVVMILDLHRQGLSISEIARRLDIDRKTVRTYLARGLEPPIMAQLRWSKPHKAAAGPACRISRAEPLLQ